MEYINKQKVLDKLAVIYDLARTDQKAPISCAISDIKDLKPDFSGDYCVKCGHDVRKDDKYFDINGATVCDCCMNTKATINNKR